jgi:hypothetical protein
MRRCAYAAVRLCGVATLRPRGYRARAGRPFCTRRRRQPCCARHPLHGSHMALPAAPHRQMLSPTKANIRHTHHTNTHTSHTHTRTQMHVHQVRPILRVPHGARRTFQLIIVSGCAVAVHALYPLCAVRSCDGEAMVQRRLNPVGHRQRPLGARHLAVPAPVRERRTHTRTHREGQTDREIVHLRQCRSWAKEAVPKARAYLERERGREKGPKTAVE